MKEKTGCLTSAYLEIRKKLIVLTLPLFTTATTLKYGRVYRVVANSRANAVTTTVYPKSDSLVWILSWWGDWSERYQEMLLNLLWFHQNGATCHPLATAEI